MGVNLLQYRNGGHVDESGKAAPARSKISERLRSVWNDAASGKPAAAQPMPYQVPGPFSRNSGYQRAKQDAARQGKRQARAQKELIDRETGFHAPGQGRMQRQALESQGFKYHGKDKSGAHVYKAGHFRHLTVSPQGWRHTTYSLTGGKKQASGRDFGELTKALKGGGL